MNLEAKEDVEEKNLNIVRLKRSYYQDKQGVHLKISLIGLKRPSSGFQLLFEDSNDIGCEYVISKIENLNECKDGVYKVIGWNERRDWETGHIDEYDYKLIPFDLPKNKQNVPLTK